MSKLRLTEQERLFCAYYALLGEVGGAAKAAGYGGDAERQGLILLEKGSVQRRVKKAAELLRRPAGSGLLRLAFGSHTDGVKLSVCGEVSPGFIDGLDLFCVSEIKRQKDGSMDVKFYDRLKALELLGTDGNADSSLQSFYKAIERGTRSAGEEAES